MHSPIPRFHVDLLRNQPDAGVTIDISGPDPTGAEVGRSYRLAGIDQQDVLDLFNALAADFGTRIPVNRKQLPPFPPTRGWTPLLTRSISPDILYGYGDPAVLRVEEQGEGVYYLAVTSNDAPNAFPILRSRDLHSWELRSFAFPDGQAPKWAATGANHSDFWAPELHRIGDGYLLVFTAREKNGPLAIGIARAKHPDGPFEPEPRPLVSGGVIDSHIFVDDDGSVLLIWKEDSNAVWPRELASLLQQRPELVGILFDEQSDRRTAALAAALSVHFPVLEPMQQFMFLQPLIEAWVENFAELRARLGKAAPEAAARAIAAMRTPVMAQRLSADRTRLLGDPQVILVNDLGWEGHLIEGPWLTRRGKFYYLFYAGNDFCTPDYGIGVAVAESPFGPFRKNSLPLLQSSSDWIAPGHPSVAPGPHGDPMLFFHAYAPGSAGYKVFRALLRARLRFEHGTVSLLDEER